MSDFVICPECQSQYKPVYGKRLVKCYICGTDISDEVKRKQASLHLKQLREIENRNYRQEPYVDKYAKYRPKIV